MMSKVVKDSGIEWIGDIPIDWKVTKINKVTKSYSGGTPSRQNNSFWEKGIIPWISSGEVNKEYIYDTNEKITTLGLQKSSAKMFPANTVIVALNGQGKTKGMSAIIKIKASTNQSLVGFICDEDRLDYRYLNYLFKSSYEFNRNYYAGGDKRDGIAAGDLKQAYIPLPEKDKQKKIAAFLDEKVAHIDNIIEDTKKSIENLKAYKQSLITETVTKGLNPNVEMKDSGIEWIGQIPKEWIVTSINTLCFVTKLAGFEYTKYINEGISDEGEVPLVRAQNIKMGRFIEENFNYIDKALSIKLNRSALYKKSLLITFIGAGIGEVALFNKSERYHLAPNVAKIEVTKNGEKYISEEYLLYYLMSQSGQEEVNKIKKATAQPSLSMETIRTIKITVPSDMTIQKEISDYLFIKTKHINNLVNQKNLIITELETYKQSLIYEYVTGKKEVK